jgi:hypothetical protein
MSVMYVTAIHQALRAPDVAMTEAVLLLQYGTKIASLCDVVKGAVITTFAHSIDGAMCCAVSPNGRHIVIGGQGSVALIEQTTSGFNIKKTLDCDSPILSVEIMGGNTCQGIIAEDVAGNFYVWHSSKGNDKEVKAMWDKQTQTGIDQTEILRQRNGHLSVRRNCFAFSPNRSQFTRCGPGGLVLICNATNFEEVSRLSKPMP